MESMDSLTPQPRFGEAPPTNASTSGPTVDRSPSSSSGTEAPSLGELFVAMRSSEDVVRELAWEACYKRYWQLVWTRVFYVMRTIPWLGEPREMAADVTSDVFVGLLDAVKHYQDAGKPEQWLKQIAVRTAMRKKEALTGRWSSGRSSNSSHERSKASPSKGRSYVSYEETADQIVDRLDTVEREEFMELNRRREELRKSPDPLRRRWDQFLELYIQGYDFKEIGEQMGLTEATARNWLCKIRKHLARPIVVSESI